MEVLQRTANRGSISTGSYEIDNSVKLEHANNEWFYRASPTEGNRRTFTFSFWIKRTRLGNPTASGTMYVAGQGQHGRMFFSSDCFTFRFDDGHVVRDVTTKHRDPAAWLHVVVAVDTNQSSSSNRVKIYFNGVQTTAIDHDGGSYPDIQDQASGWFTTNYLTVGTAPFGGSYNVGDGAYDMSGYLAEFCAVDGQQLAPTDFGEFDSDSGIWKPIDVSGINFGSEGYYLNFADAADLGDDESGNGNDFTENNIAAADQSTDTPTNNFCTFNPLIRTAGTITEGATKFTHPAYNAWMSAVASMGAGTSGKWYAEFNFPTTAANNMLGQCPIDDPDLNRGETSFPYYGSDTSLDESTGVFSNDGDIYVAGSATDYGTAYGTSDIMSIAIDMDNGKFYVAKNGTYFNSGDPTSGATGTGALDVRGSTKPQSLGPSQYTANASMLCNYGGFTTISISSAESDENGYGTFEYAPPSGYYALCTKNLAEYG